MQMTRLKTVLSLIVCIVLIAAMALFTTGCNGNNTSSEIEKSQISNGSISDTSGSSTPDTTVSQTESNVLGEGATKFTFTVTDAEGKETSYQVGTDKKTVGDALVELDLIAGDESEYGLYVKTVNGITVDYDKDGKYWTFYVNEEYATKGVDSTEAQAGATYSFKVE